MVHGYHVILAAYGFWLPNDPRGSWSEFVGKWELVRFGRTTKSHPQRDLAALTEAELRRREEAIVGAIAYVEENPTREGKPAQHWRFVTAYTGLDAGWVTYH